MKAAALGTWLAKRAPSVRCLRLVLDVHTAHDIDRWAGEYQGGHSQQQQWLREQHTTLAGGQSVAASSSSCSTQQ